MSDVLSRVNWNKAANDILVTIAVGSHLFPFRTEKLSPPAPMILQFLWESRGRLFKESYRNVTLLFFCAYSIISFTQDSPKAAGLYASTIPAAFFCSLCAKYTTLYAQKHKEWRALSLLWFESKLLTYISMLRIYLLPRREITSPK